MEAIHRVGLEEVVKHFEDLEDPRSPVNFKHPLTSVVVIALMAVLAGDDGPTAIARWAKFKAEFLVKVLDLPNGIPRKDVFRKVLSALQPRVFQNCFVNWVQSLRAKAAEALGIEQPMLSVDGKTARRSHDQSKGLGALPSVSVWASELGLSLGQVACAEKSNEITAIPEVLRWVDIRGAILTIDAMGTQKKIAADIIDLKADYVLALKGNQEKLPEEVIAYISKHMENDGAAAQARRHITKETGHGREEIRSYLHMPVPKELEQLDLWKGLKSIGMATLVCVRDGKETADTRYYIRENFAWLNRLTLSLLKLHPGKDSTIMKRRGCGWNEDFLLEVLTGATL